MKPWPACTCLFLASLLTGCAKPTVVTEYRFQYVPDVMLTDCPITPKPENMTYADWGELAEARYTDVENCNATKKAIRDYQESRRAAESRR